MKRMDSNIHQFIKIYVSIVIDAIVCPYNGNNKPRKPLSIYAAYNKNSIIRYKSSSGGVFYALAEYIISKGGYVFGAAYNDNWQVYHKQVSSINELTQLLGSKYVQSSINISFKKIKEILKTGVYVMFVGTSCQVNGLKNYLRKEYDNLLLVDFVCHGVSSPLVWDAYLKNICQSNNVMFPSGISGINFRDKKNGWRNFDFVIHSKKYNSDILREKANDNIYFKAFQKNLIIRPSCFNCPSKSGSSNSDLTMADFWGIWDINKELYDNKGTSLILVYNKKVYDILNNISSLEYSTISDTKYEDIIKYNTSIKYSKNIPSKYEQFWSEYRKKGIKVVDKYANKNDKTIIYRIYHKIKRLFT